MVLGQSACPVEPTGQSWKALQTPDPVFSGHDSTPRPRGLEKLSKVAGPGQAWSSSHTFLTPLGLCLFGAPYGFPFCLLFALLSKTLLPQRAGLGTGGGGRVHRATRLCVWAGSPLSPRPQGPWQSGEELRRC